MYLFGQEVVLSPVQNGDNKPQIDSNKANNYKIVKEVSVLKNIYISRLFFWFSSASIMHTCVSAI